MAFLSSTCRNSGTPERRSESWKRSCGRLSRSPATSTRSSAGTSSSTPAPPDSGSTGREREGLYHPDRPLRLPVHRRETDLEDAGVGRGSCRRGAPALISHRSAAWLYGIDEHMPGIIDITVPRHRRPRARAECNSTRAGCSTSPPRRRKCVTGSPSPASPGRSSTHAPLSEASPTGSTLFDEARRLKLVDWDELWDCLVVHTGRGRQGLRRYRDVLLTRDGTAPPGRSSPAGSACSSRAAGLPAPLYEHAVDYGDGLYYLDLAFPQPPPGRRRMRREDRPRLREGVRDRSRPAEPPPAARVDRDRGDLAAVRQRPGGGGGRGASVPCANRTAPGPTGRTRRRPSPTRPARKPWCRRLLLVGEVAPPAVDVAVHPHALAAGLVGPGGVVSHHSSVTSSPAP